jgi:hypothetical protein
MRIVIYVVVSMWCFVIPWTSIHAAWPTDPQVNLLVASQGLDMQGAKVVSNG